MPLQEGITGGYDPGRLRGRRTISGQGGGTGLSEKVASECKSEKEPARRGLGRGFSRQEVGPCAKALGRK